jgi:outer membrane protein OmpA-like peptidoglycan-associated protein
LIVVALAGCHGSPRETAPTNINARKPEAERTGRVVVTETSVRILPPIKFDGLTANVELEGLETLDAVAATLDGNPNILLVEVQAFGADGDPHYQQVIGEQRAKGIVDYLIKKGVAPGRLRFQGIAKPAPGHGNQPNFVILQRAE